MIGIIGAMDEEIKALVGAMDHPQSQTIAGRQFWCGSLQGCEITLTCSGIGKVSAAITATVLIEHFKADAVINTGSAGAIDPELDIGDTVFSKRAAYHDFNLTAFGYKLGQVPGNEQYFTADEHLIQAASAAAAGLKGFKVYTGDILSGDQFIHDAAVTAGFKRNFPQALVTEMEGAAIAQVCSAFKVPFLIIRSVSDNADHSSTVKFDDFLPLAARNSAALLQALLLQLKNSAAKETV